MRKEGTAVFLIIGSKSALSCKKTKSFMTAGSADEAFALFFMFILQSICIC